ncbi:CLUMA_CG002078, isoform A [Clunio marinus]|uniref:CLUMA_CG002078, isoform A n=1 Tax=Clunio marinus TaxID=568069 RepID=A0A1J1HK48_9DIPT|nr:CLUMA_CG002078, isoform A [Clunio marinus]
MASTNNIKLTIINLPRLGARVRHTADFMKSMFKLELMTIITTILVAKTRVSVDDVKGIFCCWGIGWRSYERADNSMRSVSVVPSLNLQHIIKHGTVRLVIQFIDVKC